MGTKNEEKIKTKRKPLSIENPKNSPLSRKPKKTQKSKF